MDSKNSSKKDSNSNKNHPSHKNQHNNNNIRLPYNQSKYYAFSQLQLHPTFTLAKFPPINQKELECIIIDFLISKQKLTIDSLSIFRIIKSYFSDFDGFTYIFKTLNVNQIIRDLSEKGLLKIKKINIDLRLSYLIEEYDYQKLKKYKAENNELYQLNMSGDVYNEAVKKATIEYYKKYFNTDKSKKIKDMDCLYHNIYEDEGIIDYNFNDYNSTYYLGQKTDREEIKYEDQDYNKAINVEEKINNILYGPTAISILSSSVARDIKTDGTDGSEDFSGIIAKIREKYGTSHLKPFCEYGTRENCRKKNRDKDCENAHFVRIIKPHTKVECGDCSYLDTCRNMDTCPFVHYRIEDSDAIPSNRKELILSGDPIKNIIPSQWIRCDIRNFRYDILGKFSVIMADPPWDIHMELPYGTMHDEEMKNLPLKNLQTDGIIFLWVTGRAMELARECMEIWGYERKEELVWIKTNQLQRLIRTGRTGHWLNHSKEHCLIGVKGNPALHCNLDCDVLVSEVRETSRKPDEIYEIIERMSPGGRKLELFARAHNRRQGWLSLGNQLPGVYLVEQEVIEKYNEAYPDNKVTREKMDECLKNSTKVKKKGE